LRLIGGSVENVNPYEDPLRFMCVLSLGPSHVEVGGGDTLSHVQNPLVPFEVHERSPNCSLVPEQLEIRPVESQLESKGREQRERVQDLEHYSKQEWRFARILHEIKDVGPGRKREKAIELFWISVYNGVFRNDSDILKLRGHALEQYLQLRDEVEERMDHGEDGIDALPHWSGGGAGVAQLQG
jgi:hypothetical protein